MPSYICGQRKGCTKNEKGALSLAKKGAPVCGRHSERAGGPSAGLLSDKCIVLISMIVR